MEQQLAPKRHFEEQAEQILKLFLSATIERTRDAIQIDYLGDQGITLLLTPEALEVRLPTIDWTQGSCGPVASSRLWKRVEWAMMDHEEVVRLCGLALEERASEFRQCRYCHQDYPPEYRFSEDVCHGCAERHLHVVF